MFVNPDKIGMTFVKIFSIEFGILFFILIMIKAL